MTTATEQHEKERAKETQKRALHAAVKEFTIRFAPTAREGLGDFMADFNALVSDIYRDVMRNYEDIIAASMLALSSVKIPEEATGAAVPIGSVDVDTLRSILGYDQYQKYLRNFFIEQPNLGPDNLSNIRFLISRAQEYANGKYIDLGGYNIVARHKLLPKAGHCITLPDPEKPHTSNQVGAHIWQTCPCPTCVAYRRDIQW